MPACPKCAGERTCPGEPCPHCGAPGQECGYEWKSSRNWGGLPLVHVAFGADAGGKVREARGVLAIGQRAVGVIAIGIIARGVLAIGVVAFGLGSIGVVAVAGLLALGVNAAAPVAFGVVAAGYAAGGVAPIGWKILFCGAAGLAMNRGKAPENRLVRLPLRWPRGAAKSW